MIRFSPNQNRAHLINWLEWGPEAFQKARDQDKLVMLYLGAFWCGFCQSMDETSFSDDEVIVLLNAYFVPIRVENAQRPDIDVRYNQNGWPTIVFMTPQGDRVATVNHLPAEDFCSVLVRIQAACQEKKGEFLESAPPVNLEASAAAPEAKIRASAVFEISNALMALSDEVNGGYGPDHKFPHPEANDFLIYRYETTGDAAFLDHVARTLSAMRASETYDNEDWGFFRYSSKADWSEPHREKLLADQAGILGNCLRVFQLTQRAEYRQLAEEVIGYVDGALSGPSGSAFFGCQDYLHVLIIRNGEPVYNSQKTFSVVDELVYTDANAQAVSSYLEASRILGRPDCRDRALGALEFLWNHCRAAGGGMRHYHDGEPHVPGLLVDQIYTGIALLDAYGATREAGYLERAAQLGDEILDAQTNPFGGFHDISREGMAHLRYPLTLLAENGIAAMLFLRLADSAGERKYRKAALWALGAFTEDFTPYGVYAAAYGRALGAYMSLPIQTS